MKQTTHRWTKDSNPRKNGQHKERGPKRWEVSVAEVAELAGVRESTVRDALRFEDSEKQKRSTLVDVFGFLVSRISKRSRKLEQPEIEGLLEDGDYALWEKRWPQFELWTCGVPGCSQLRFAEGLCEKHGGVPLIDADDAWIFQVRLDGKWVPLADVIAGGKNAVHVDGNRWNCRPSNLRLENSDKFSPVVPPRPRWLENG